jgi:hypothetical protein
MGEYPFVGVHSDRFWNTVGAFRQDARRLRDVVSDYGGFGFSPPTLDGSDAAFKPLLDEALAAGRNDAKALALDQSEEGPRVSNSPEFLAADREAGAALKALLDSVWQSFGVAEGV